jgi:RNA polymerase sigma-70 factor (ECF subfamily)
MPREISPKGSGILGSVPYREPRTATPEISSLLGEIAQGSERALEELYGLTSAAVYGLAVKVLGSREEAQEATLSVYVQVWRSASTFDSALGDGAAWLFMLARSRTLDRLRALRRRPSCTDILDHVDELADEQEPPHRSADLRERSAALRRALEGIPSDERRAILATFFGGCTHLEVAQALGAPLGTIKARIRRGMLRLKAALAPLEGELG